MNRRNCVVAVICLLIVCCDRCVQASAVSTFFGLIFRNLSKDAAEVAEKKAIKEVGEVVIERVATKVVKEGSEAAMERLTAVLGERAPDVLPTVIRALDNAPSVGPILKSLGELPAQQIPEAAARLAAGAEGKQLAETAIRYGSIALKAEVVHPGIGGQFVRALGREGADLSGHLSNDQAIAIGRHVNDIARLAPTQRTELLKLISAQTDRFVQFVGRFVEKNPGKVLFTTATTTVILANSERMLGNDEIVFDRDGNPTVVSKPGMVQRIAEPTNKAVAHGIYWLIGGLAIVVVLFVGGIAIVKIWGMWRRERQTAIERV